MGDHPFVSKTIMEVFNDLDYDEKHYTSNDFVEWSYSRESDNLNFMKSLKSFDEAVKAAVEAQQIWANTPLLKRGKMLYKIWKELQSASNSFSKLKNQLSMFSDYFDFYSDLLFQTEEYKSWTPCGVIFIIVSSWTSLFAAAATIPAALAAGCSLIISAPEKDIKFFLLLKEIFLKSGLKDNLFNVVTETEERDESVFEKADRVFFYGSFISAQKFYAKTSVTSFNFFSPSNAAAIVLESADLDAAVNKIISETWGENTSFAISNVVVQESVYKKFFDLLKYKMSQFMMENKHSLKFKDDTVAEKIKDITSKALIAGASVEEVKSCGKWSPTVIVNYQNQDIDQEAPVLKILLCRTAKEGVTLLNNCRYTLATSIWSEISSEALEVSSELISPNVWINCHGIVDAGVSFQLFGFSGNFVLGGIDGILEFMSPVMDNLSQKLDYENIASVISPDFGEQSNQPDLSYKAFKSWRWQNRRPYLYQIANSVEDDCLSNIIDYYTHSGSVIRFFDRNSGKNEKIFTLKKKIPIGVILLCIMNEIDKKTFISLIMPAISFGNAVIVILRKKNPSIESIVEMFVKILPNSLLSIYVGLNINSCLVSHPNIQAIWWYPNNKFSLEIFQLLKRYSKKYLKQIWIVPERVPLSQNLFQNKCLHNKVVWLPKIDQFP